jgi:hypothetical protein
MQNLSKSGKSILREHADPDRLVLFINTSAQGSGPGLPIVNARGIASP